MEKLTTTQLLGITWELRYASDEASVNKRDAAVAELVERGYPELD